MRIALIPLVLLSFAGPALCARDTRPDMSNQIVDQAFNHGQAVETAAYLSDQIGGRLTNSPGMRHAEQYTQQRFRDWGLSNVRTEGFEFGRGWWIESSSVQMIEPRLLSLKAIPLAWTPSTMGTVTAPVIIAVMKSETDFPSWRAKLAGRIVLISDPKPPLDQAKSRFSRFSDADIAAMDVYKPPASEPSREDKDIEEVMFERKLDRFLHAEGAIAWVRMSEMEGHIMGDSLTDGFKPGQAPAVPAIELAPSDYRRLIRLATTGTVKLAVDIKTHFVDDDPKAYNIFADISGRDVAAGYVMAGAHLDSWVAGDGAADNAAGVAVVMEAARILAALHVRPRRTIRFVLWAGEEQGLLGSFAYVSRHLARRPLPADAVKAGLAPWWWVDSAFPIKPLPGYSRLAGYFNLDNGGGKIRGIYGAGNFVAMPILKEWLAPFASMGAANVVGSANDGSDQVAMAKTGLPAFSFIQDPLDYFSEVHHSEGDTFDRLRPDDLRQAATIVAATLLAAAEREQPLPGKGVPTRPGSNKRP